MRIAFVDAAVVSDFKGKADILPVARSAKTIKKQKPSLDLGIYAVSANRTLLGLTVEAKVLPAPLTFMRWPRGDNMHVKHFLRMSLAKLGLFGQ